MVEHKELTRIPQHASPLSRWGTLIVRWPWQFLIVPLLLALALMPLAMRATDNLTTVGWTPVTADSHQVQLLMEEEFGRATTNHYVLFSDPAGVLMADDREFRLAVEQTVRSFRNDPDIAAVYTWGSTRNEGLNIALISDDRSQSIAVIVMEHTAEPGAGGMNEVSNRLTSDRLEVQIGGWPATAETFLDLARSDLTRAELISLPITLFLLFVVFGGVLAAGLPVLLAALSMMISLAALAALSRIMMVNIFSINAVTMLGLAVGIDYALVMVSRFREESATTPIVDSIPRVLETAGRAVIIAGSTVAIGLMGLLMFGVPAAVSTGLAGACVVLACVILSLTALPACFALWGHRIGRRSTWGARPPQSIPRIAGQVERWREQHPATVLLLCSILLISLALPLRHIVMSSPTMTILPPTSDARIVYDTVAEHFPNATLSPLTIIVEPHSGTMMQSSNLAALQTLTRKLAGVEGVTAVDSVWGYIPLGITPEAFATSLLLEPELVRATEPFLTRNASLISLTADASLDAEGRRNLVATLRESMPAFTTGDLTVRIGGDAGLDRDLMQHVAERQPLVVGFVVGLTWLALFLQFRSVFLPVKAILLNLLSLGASFGSLVWIFQDGHLSGLLGFEPTGYTVVLIPILMFCFLFGLSMDFEVIMLSRIREAWEETGDNTRAIDLGLQRSASIVTSSAAVMLVVFAAFGASELQVIKSLGVGLGIAVLIDATVIRMLLLPATMQLMGHWNWWSPFWKAQPDQAAVSAPLSTNAGPGENSLVEHDGD